MKKLTGKIKRFKAWVSIMLILLGLCLLGQSAYIHAKAWLAQVLLEQAWQNIQQGEARAKPWPWADTWPVARLQVPELKIDLFILAGDSARNLAFGPGHNFASAQPGEIGNSLISAHRDTHFAFLQYLQKNDEIIIQTTQGKQVFSVDSTQVMHRDQARFPIDEQNAHIHLVTCYPFDSMVPGGSSRYIVSASTSGKVF